MKTYQQTLDYLYARLPMFSRIGSAAYKPNLENTVALCASLNEPQKQFKSVHIAGTNGKGSVSHMTAAILQQAGYKTGLYTSPHLHDFRERIRVNGEMIHEQFVVEFTQNIAPQIDALNPSFFEITVAMAFAYFAAQKVDIAIIETGLGGRLDSTNIITPLLSVITNIGYDHMNLLGNTLQQIAGEKAGIIKSSVPVIIGEILPETKPVFIKKALQENAPICFANEMLQVADWALEANNFLKVSIANKANDERHDYHLSLTGLYQLKNVVTVLETVAQLRLQQWQIEDRDVKAGLQHVQKLTGFAGRWQIINQLPYTVLDVGHNEDGVRQIVSQLEHCTFQKLHIVLGMVRDKDIANVLRLLPRHAVYYFTQAAIERALPANELLEKATEFKLQGHAYATVRQAFQHAKTYAQNEDMILVCGSVFVVGEVPVS